MQSSVRRSPFSLVSLAVLTLTLLVVVFTASPLFSQNQSQNPQPSDSSAQQQQQQQNDQAAPEAGGPQGETSPMAIPKKKDEPPPPPKPKFKNPEGIGNYSISVNSSLVTVPVSVLTKKGEFIPGLKKENFRVTEDGVPQQITSFSQTEAPITAVLLLEFAAKHYSFLNDMLNNAYGFAQSLKPNDWVAVIAYDMHDYIVQDFTQDKSQVYGALNQLRIPGFSETNEFDALYDTLDRLDRIPGRKYIILISSGVDTFSRKNFDTILKKVKGSPDVTIFPISTGFFFREMADPYLDPSETMPGQTDRLDYLQADNEMNTFAKLTGGKAYFPRFTGQVHEVIGDISNTIRNQYAIAYHPTNAKQDGSYRKIKVELIDPQSGGPINLHINGKPEKDYKIVAREGYTAKREVE